MKKFLLIILLFLLLANLSHRDGVKEPEITEKITASVPSSEFSERVGDHDRVYAQTIRAIDGDTIVVENEEREYTVRLLGIDAPEMRRSQGGAECFATLATNRIQKLLSESDWVFLETDASQGEYDQYGRLLAYVYLPLGTRVNDLLIHEGYAREYTYRLPYRYQHAFQKAEEIAKEEGKGMWSACGII